MGFWLAKRERKQEWSDNMLRVCWVYWAGLNCAIGVLTQFDLFWFFSYSRVGTELMTDFFDFGYFS